MLLATPYNVNSTDIVYKSGELHLGNFRAGSAELATPPRYKLQHALSDPFLCYCLLWLHKLLRCGVAFILVVRILS
jgi:hypothetical protein